MPSIEALQDTVYTVIWELSHLHNQQCSAIESRDHAKEGEIMERIEELTRYREHLQNCIEEETKTAQQLAALGSQPDISLTYLSFWKEPLSQQEVAYIGLYGRVANQKKCLSSCLMAIPQPGAFFQVIEGPEALVDELFAKVSQDSRHHRVSLLQRETISSRRFGSQALWVRSVEEVDAVHEVQLAPLLACLLEAVSAAEKYAPPLVSQQLARGGDPLSEQGTMAELVVAFIGMRSITLGSLGQLARPPPTGSSSHPALTVAQGLGNLIALVHAHVGAAGGTCYPWIGNGMLVTFRADAASEAVECMVGILKEAVIPYPLCIGIDAGLAFSTVCGRGPKDLMLGLLGAPVTTSQQVAQEVCRSAECSLLLTAACHRLVHKVDRQYTLAWQSALGPLFTTAL